AMRGERFEEGDERGRLRRAQVLSVGRHVPAALDHLADQLILREPHRDAVQRGPALTTRAAQRVAVAALLELQDQRSVPLESGPSLQILLRDRLAPPRLPP